MRQRRDAKQETALRRVITQLPENTVYSGTVQTSHGIMPASHKLPPKPPPKEGFVTAYDIATNTWKQTRLLRFR